MNATLEIPILPQRTIALDPPLTDEEFEWMCEQTRSALLERTKEGTITMNAPAGGTTSSGNNEIARQLGNWWIRHRPGRVFDSSAGFFLPDDSMLNPDAAYVAPEQLKGLTRADLARFPRLAPAFIIELRSETDRLAAVQEKMEAGMANGVQLGWLIDPEAKQVRIYAQGAAPRIESGTAVAGSGPIEGFVLDVEEVWRCYE